MGAQPTATEGHHVRAPLVGAQPHAQAHTPPDPGEGTHKGRPYGNTQPGSVGQPKTLGDVMGAFKSLTTGAYIRGVRQSGWPGFRGKLWHRNYYEHIIRSETELNRIREYIANNPARWDQDDENPERIK